MSTDSGAMQLRYLQTLSDMSTNNANSSTIVFPLPMDLMEAFRKKATSTGAPRPTSGDPDKTES
jgi:hypothetical protein